MRTFDANRYFIVISDDDSDQESEISPAHKRPRRIEKAGNMLDTNLKTMRIAVRQTQLAFIKSIPARRTAYDHATAAIDLEPRDKIVGTNDIEILESLGGTLDREWREGTAPAFHGEHYIVSTLPNDESLHVTTNLRPQSFLTAVHASRVLAVPCHSPLTVTPLSCRSRPQKFLSLDSLKRPWEATSKAMIEFTKPGSTISNDLEVPERLGMPFS
jgi:hypothetical protein